MIKNFVFDTNILISALLLGSNTNSAALRRASHLGFIFCSPSIREEIVSVFMRKKFDAYVSRELRLKLLKNLNIKLISVPEPLERIKASRDSKDDKYLELAIANNSSCIVSGDKDLLVLNPFGNVPIITAAEFLNLFDYSFLLNEPEAIYNTSLLSIYLP